MHQHPALYTATNWHHIAELILQALEDSGDIFEDRAHALAKVEKQISVALSLKTAQSSPAYDKDYLSNIDFGRNDAEFIFRTPNEAQDMSHRHAHLNDTPPSLTYSDIR